MLLLKSRVWGCQCIDSRFQRRLNRDRKTVHPQKRGLISIMRTTQKGVYILRCYSYLGFNLENRLTQKIHNKNTIPYIIPGKTTVWKISF